MESWWRPRSAMRFMVGLVAAVALPVLMTEVVKSSLIDKFPSLAYIACVVVAALLGRLVAGILAVLVCVLLLDYYVIKPAWTFNPLHGTEGALDFLLFVGVGVLVAAALAATDRSRAQAWRAHERTDIAQRQLTIIAEVAQTLAASFDLSATVRQVSERIASAGEWDNVLVLRPPYDALQGTAALDIVTTATGSHQIQVLTPAGWRRRPFGPWRYRSGLVVPLVPNGYAVGAMVLLHSRKRRIYLPADLQFTGEIGARIAVAVDNATRYQQQVHIAHTLQQSLLPRSLPTIPGVKVHALYQAGAGTEVGGDFYDVFSVGGGKWMAVIGDVCGKGPEAATVMSVTRATLRALAMHEPSPSRLLSRLNEALIAQIPDDRFVTVACALIEVIPAGGAKVLLAQAGHPRPVISRKGSAPTLAPAANGMLLGAFPAVELTETPIGLAPGEALTFYTDGIELTQVPAQDQAMVLLTAHGNAPAAQIAERFAAAVPSTPAGKSDDLVVLTFEFT